MAAALISPTKPVCFLAGSGRAMDWSITVWLDKLMAVAIPVLLFNVQLTSMGYVGIALIIFGGFCLKWGGAAV